MMTIYRIITADVLEGLAKLPDESVQCVVTSPPYWGLRDYGTASWEGGDPECDHRGKPFATKANINRNCGTGRDVKNAEDREFFREVCGKCGARRVDQQIGLEGTPEEYVEAMVGVFREVRRVLRKDGVCWVNLGDSYASGGHGGGGSFMEMRGGDGSDQVGSWSHRKNKKGWRSPPPGLKPKDLVGIPWRVALALQADGWWLRQDIIWSKPNPMPESVRDRCTKAHEYVFLLTKGAQYFWDGGAIREEGEGYGRGTDPSGRMFRRVGDAQKPAEHISGGKGHSFEGGRNRRSVWTIPTQPCPEAHFATFPEALVEPCVLAGSQAGNTVLDPFAGRGTVGIVCARLNRSFIGIELNPEYAAIAERNCSYSFAQGVFL